MLKERNVSETWVKQALEESELKESKDDGTVHYVRAIEEHEGRHLRVVVNICANPWRVVTVFFDRRLRRLS